MHIRDWWGESLKVFLFRKSFVNPAMSLCVVEETPLDGDKDEILRRVPASTFCMERMRDKKIYSPLLGRASRLIIMIEKLLLFRWPYDFSFFSLSRLSCIGGHKENDAYQLHANR